MSDALEQAFDAFADAAEAQLVRMSGEIRSLREELDRLRTEQRAAPVQAEPIPGPAGEPGPAGRSVQVNLGSAAPLNPQVGDLWLVP